MKYKDLYKAAKREDFLEWLFNRKKYKIWELETMKVYNQNPEHHPEGYSVFDHVIAAVRDFIRALTPLSSWQSCSMILERMLLRSLPLMEIITTFMGMTRKVKNRFAVLQKI